MIADEHWLIYKFLILHDPNDWHSKRNESGLNFQPVPLIAVTNLRRKTSAVSLIPLLGIETVFDKLDKQGRCQCDSLEMIELNKIFGKGLTVL